ncbi:MAG: type I glutamate--ammonia ligase [Planctomycetota bacterium]
MSDDKAAAVLERARNDGVKLVELQFVDIFGAVKSTTIPIERLEETLAYGQAFDGSSIEGFARIQESDLVLRLDPATYAVLPWRPRSAGAECRIICDVETPGGKPYESSPRHILRKMLQRAEDMGFVYCVGTEQEFELFPREFLDKPELLEKTKEGFLNYYFDFTSGSGMDVRRDMILALEKMGMQVEMSHHEVAPKQHEIDIRYADAMRHADDAITLRYVVKAVAQQSGFHATFMPKTRQGVNGVGMHTNQSLLDRETGKNAFVDSSDTFGLSQTAYRFLAGQLKHIRSLSAITNPLVNSYKRIVPGYEAPCYVSWGRMNRSALIRVPGVQPGKEERTRLELRSPDPACNPYLSFALLLAAGLEGIEEGLSPIKPCEENVFEATLQTADPENNVETLPTTLGEAIAEFERSELARKVLGEHAFHHYITGKKAEWNEFRSAVTDWEIRKYFKFH